MLSFFSEFCEWEFGTFSDFWTRNLRRNKLNWLERCTGIAEVRVRIPASLIFSGFLFRNCISCVNNCEDLLHIFLELYSKVEQWNSGRVVQWNIGTVIQYLTEHERQAKLGSWCYSPVLKFPSLARIYFKPLVVYPSLRQRHAHLAIQRIFWLPVVSNHRACEISNPFQLPF